jgi:enoyl-CoA hydratase/carnithine racemase
MPDRQSDPVLVARPEPWLAIITLNREGVRNAISTEMATLLSGNLAELGGDEQLRSLIVTGAGNRAFSSGADLKERHLMTPSQRTRHTEAIRDVADQLYAFPVPVVAAIRGLALAGGAEVAIACDLRVAGDSTVFAFPEAARGIFPGAGAVKRLPRLVGSGSARRLLFTGRRIDAAESFRIGLIDAVVSDDYVLSEATKICREIASQSPNAIRAVKQAIRISESLPSENARLQIAALRAELDAGDDYEEGLAAYVEKRKPYWSIEPEGEE